MADDPWSNDIVKRACHDLHIAIIKDVKADDVIDELFAAKVVTLNDLDELSRPMHSGREKMRSLMITLYKSRNDRSFIVLRRALLSGYSWLVAIIDKRCREIEYQSMGRSACTVRMTLVHSLTDGSKSVSGMTILDKDLYVMYEGQEVISVYDTETHKLKHCPSIIIRGLGNVHDMASCTKHRCIYIADGNNRLIHRFAIDSGHEQSQWRVDGRPWGLSVNFDNNVIVTFGGSKARKINLFTTNGVLVTEIRLQLDIVHPSHTIQLSAGEKKFIVCHGSDTRHDLLHRVCIVDANGRIEQLLGGQKGSKDDQLNSPVRLAAVRNIFIVVADFYNNRLLILSSMLRYIDQVSLSSSDGRPTRLWLDEKTRQTLRWVQQWTNSNL